MNIREEILNRIKSLGIKQVDVASRAGIQQQNLSSFLKGTRTMPLPQIEKVCEVLGLTLGPVDNVCNSNVN